MDWPGSEVFIDGSRPTFTKPYNDSETSMERVNQVLKWINDANAPKFIGLYLNEIDTAGHYKGPDSKEVENSLIKVEEALKYLIHNLPGGLQDFNVIIVSDHGMAKQIDDNQIMLEDLASEDIFDRIKLADVGPITLIWPKEGEEDSMYQDIKDMSENMGYGLMVYNEKTMPIEYRYRGPRVAPIVIECQVGWTISSRNNTWIPGGQHGYNPKTLEMHGIFIAHGPDISPRYSFYNASNLDLYPLLTHLMKINSTPNNGSDTLMQVLL